jgi:hypothetical protein
MSNATKRNTLAWALIAAPILLFGLALLMSRACPGALMFCALTFVSHMPMFALPFWAVFHGYRRAGIFLGWLMFILGELGFFFFYATYFKKYGWPSPEPPGLFFIAILFGWGFGWLVVMVADSIKQMADRRWPILRHDNAA